MSDLAAVEKLNGNLSTGTDISGEVASQETAIAGISSEENLDGVLANELPLTESVISDNEEMSAALSEDAIEAMLTTNDATLNGEVSDNTYELTADLQPGTGTGGGEGTNDYTQLINKPKIEGITLVGNKMFPDLNLRTITNSELEEILKL